MPNEGPGYILLWSTVSKGANYALYVDTPKGRQSLLEDYATIVGSTALYYQVFRLDTANVLALALAERDAPDGPVA